MSYDEAIDLVFDRWCSLKDWACLEHADEALGPDRPQTQELQDWHRLHAFLVAMRTQNSIYMDPQMRYFIVPEPRGEVNQNHSIAMFIWNTDTYEWKWFLSMWIESHETAQSFGLEFAEEADKIIADWHEVERMASTYTEEQAEADANMLGGPM